MNDSDKEHVKRLIEEAEDLDTVVDELTEIINSYQSKSKELVAKARALCTHPPEDIVRHNWSHMCVLCGTRGTSNPSLFGDDHLR